MFVLITRLDILLSRLNTDCFIAVSVKQFVNHSTKLTFKTSRFWVLGELFHDMSSFVETLQHHAWRKMNAALIQLFFNRP